MSQAPHAIRNIRFGVPLGKSPQLEDTLWAGLTDTYCNLSMALTAEKLGSQNGITREETDKFSLRSQQLWKEGMGYKFLTKLHPILFLAQEAQRFNEELVPVPIRSKKSTELSVDEHPRPQTTFEGLQSLKPVFKENGLVTAGSASVIT